MASALTILLLGCWLAGQSRVSGQLPAPGPSISVSPSRVIAPGGAITIRCQCQCKGRRLFLYKDEIEIRELDAAGDRGEFTISSARRENGGVYMCRSHSRSEPPNWSYPSVTVWIIVAESYYPKPSISLRPSWGVSLGGAVTVRCRGPYQNMRFLLYKDGNPTVLQDVEPAGYMAEFPIRSVSRRDAGSYSCCYRDKWYLVTWSHPSDPMELVVADPGLPRPSISLNPTEVTAPGADVTIRCQGPRWDVRFFLHKAGDLNPQQHMDPAGAGAEFRIPSVGWQHGGSYSCSYRPWSEPFVSSQPSDPVQLVVAGLTSPIITGVSAAAAGLLLLLLLVAFICFRKTRARKGAASRPNSTSPMVTLKALAQQNTIYASIDEGKELQTLPQEPDPGADGLTYAELDGRALQAKQGGLAPAPEPAQPSVYAAINVSRGPHSESPPQPWGAGP